MYYLDYQATTPLAPEALEAMLPWLGGPGSDGFANPSSQYRAGRAAAVAVELAREQVAALLPKRRPGLFHLRRDGGAELGAGLAARASGRAASPAARSSIMARCSGSRTRARS